MGNACGCVESNQSEMSLAKEPDKFLLDDYQTKFVKEAFAPLSDSEKDVVLAEILKLIIYKGDTSSIREDFEKSKLFGMVEPRKVKVVIYRDEGFEETFEGYTEDGMASGAGECVHRDGSVYKGGFRGGFKKGKGVVYQQKEGKKVDLFHLDHNLCHGVCVMTSDTSTTVFNMNKGYCHGPIYSSYAALHVFSIMRQGLLHGYYVKVFKDYKKVVLCVYDNNVLVDSITYNPLDQDASRTDFKEKNDGMI